MSTQLSIITEKHARIPNIEEIVLAISKTYMGECHVWQNLGVTISESKVVIEPSGNGKIDIVIEIIKSSNLSILILNDITIERYSFIDENFDEANGLELYQAKKLIGTIIKKVLHVNLIYADSELYFEGEVLKM